MTTPEHDRIDEGRALLAAIQAIPPEAPTACSDWRAHDLVAHLAAGAGELADLIERRLDGRPDRPTRPFDQREAPFRALAHDVLVGRLVEENIRMFTALDVLRSRPDDSIAFTGASVSTARLDMHLRSEAALHRWDLVGSDEVSDRLLAQPELTAHAVWVLNEMPVLDESARAIGQHAAQIGVPTRSLALVAPGEPAVVLRLDGSGTRLELAAEQRAAVVVEMGAADRLLAIWGRRSADAVARALDGSDPTRALDALRWADATPWAPRTADVGT